MDSDGQHTVEDALKLYQYIKDNPDVFKKYNITFTNSERMVIK